MARNTRFFRMSDRLGVGFLENADMTHMVTQSELVRDLRALGVAAGDILLVHSSYKSLGPVEGGAAMVVAALEEAIAPGGLLLMTSFNLVKIEERASSWDHASTPSTVGYLTEFFRKMAGSYRSDHYSHSVAARGPGAKAFVAGHRELVGFDSPWDQAPWGKTFGAHSPMLRAYDGGGSILMLGVDYHSSTYMHLVEVMAWNNARRTNPDAEYCWINREKLGAWWDEHGIVRRGFVARADCRLIPIRVFVDDLLAEIGRHPSEFFII